MTNKSQEMINILSRLSRMSEDITLSHAMALANQYVDAISETEHLKNTLGILAFLLLDDSGNPKCKELQGLESKIALKALETLSGIHAWIVCGPHPDGMAYFLKQMATEY